jgi:hypothetical protein
LLDSYPATAAANCCNCCCQLCFWGLRCLTNATANFCCRLASQACTTTNWETLVAEGANKKVGTTLEGYELVTSPATIGQCQSACDKRAACWGFLFTAADGGKCLLRAGDNVQNARSFFLLAEKNATVCNAGFYRNMANGGACAGAAESVLVGCCACCDHAWLVPCKAQRDIGLSY